MSRPDHPDEPIRLRRTEMTTYRITNSASAAVLGTFVANSKEAALDMLAQAAGYADHASVPAEIGGGDDIEVEDIDYDIDKAFRQCIDGIEDNQVCNGGFYAEWTDASDALIYCDFGEDHDEYTAEQTMIHAVYMDDVACEVLRSHIQVWLDGKIEGERHDIQNAVRFASDLDGLQKALEAADEYAKATHVDVATLYDATDLPTFGGDDIADTDRVYSWDADYVLTQDDESWKQVTRFKP